MLQAQQRHGKSMCNALCSNLAKTNLQFLKPVGQDLIHVSAHALMLPQQNSDAGMVPHDSAAALHNLSCARVRSRWVVRLRTDGLSAAIHPQNDLIALRAHLGEFYASALNQ